MTAHAMTGDREKSLAIGMNDHVAKPIDPNELFTTLGIWILPTKDWAHIRVMPPESSASVSETVSDQTTSQTLSDLAKDEFPQFLAGFDLMAGLKRLQGNRRLYRKLLLDFNVGFASTAQDIQRALIANDIKQMHSLVHNIKGLAGNLSAIRLQSTATQLDGLVKRALTGKKPEPHQMDRSVMELKNAWTKR